MTRRERLERKIERRAEWAEKAAARSSQRFNTAHKIADAIPFGQPILVGHHSEKHARADAARIDNNMRKGCELADLAEHHESKAAGLANQLDRAIFSDDTNATDALKARIAENEAKRDQMKKINALYRKADAAGLAALGINIDQLKAKLAEAGSYWGSAPHLPYELTNLGARIRDDKKRLEQIERDQVRKAKAEDAPNGVTLEPRREGYCLITFAEKPKREILDALKAAGFWWAKGSWAGKQDQMPPCVAELLTPPEPPTEPEKPPIFIEGSPGGPDGKWEAVQAIQHQPFIYVHYNGSPWKQGERDHVAELIDMMGKYRLDSERFGPEFHSVNPRYGIVNPAWTWGSGPDVPHYIDGDRMYAADGVVRFSGNFEAYSWSFCIETNHQPTIDAILKAIELNRSLAA